MIVLNKCYNCWKNSYRSKFSAKNKEAKQKNVFFLFLPEICISPTVMVKFSGSHYKYLSLFFEQLSSRGFNLFSFYVLNHVFKKSALRKNIIPVCSGWKKLQYFQFNPPSNFLWNYFSFCNPTLLIHETNLIIKEFKQELTIEDTFVELGCFQCIWYCSIPDFF